MIIPEKDMVFVPKLWGWERWIINNDLYCGKILHFYKDKKCSWHFHRIKTETLFFKGNFTLKYSFDDDLDKAKTLDIVSGTAFHVISFMRHQMIAKEESEIYEFSTHHEDSDSIKILIGD